MKEITQYYNNDTQCYKDSCAGTNCSNKPTAILKVRYINKTGHFCKQHAKDLLDLELVEKIPAGGIHND